MATRGDLTEAAVLKAFVALDLAVFLPWRHDLPFDLVVSADHKTFLRVQCKSGREREGCVLFNSAGTDHGRGRQHYRDRADLLAVWCPTIDQVFVVPVDEAAGYVTSLRLRPSRNNQVRGIRFAADHTVERWAATLSGRVAA
jgi:hypothetical protein